jgi:hypothetical protein
MVRRTFVPLDIQCFSGQHPSGPEHGSVEFTMRKGLIHMFAHLNQPNLVLAARLIPDVLRSPNATFQDWMDLTWRGFPRNCLYTREFHGSEVAVGSIRVPVPMDKVVFGVIADREKEILDYGWFEGCEIPGFPRGHDDPDVIGGVLWKQT